MPHLTSLASTKQQVALSTYLICITEQIWLPYSKYSLQGKHAKWPFAPKHLCIYRPQYNQLLLLLHMLLLNMCQKHAHQIGCICHTHLIFGIHIMGMYTHICAIHESCSLKLCAVQSGRDRQRQQMVIATA